MTTHEAARLIGCCERHVRTLISRGKIDARVVPVDDGRPSLARRYEVSLEEVHQFLNHPQIQGWPRGKSRRAT